MLLTGTLIMWVTSRSVRNFESREITSVQSRNNTQEASQKSTSTTYNWLLVSLIIIVIGAACVSQVFLLFMGISARLGGLNLNDEEIGGVLIAWTLGGMLMSLSSGWLADRIGRAKVLLVGMILAAVTPLLYGLATDFWSLAVFYGLNGVSFWAIQTVGFAFAGDLIPEEQRGRLFGRYNAVMALSWGPAGLLVGGPLADLQIRSGFSELTAYLNTFYLSAAIVAVGTLVFAFRVALQKKKSS
jgi:MFS family permease